MHEVESKRVWRAPRLQSFGSLGGVTGALAGTIPENLGSMSPPCKSVGTPSNTMKYPCG